MDKTALIAAQIEAIEGLVARVAADVKIAAEEARNGNRNGAMGALGLAREPLEAPQALTGAAFALHRL